MIKVQRDKDKKIFTTDMSAGDCIYEMHFCTSYTQVMIQELNDNGKFDLRSIICPPVGTQPNWVDLIATQNDDTGIFLEG